MGFTTPLALILLGLLPFFLWLGWPSGSWGLGRRRLALITRMLIVLLLVLALAGMQSVRATDGIAVVYLIDASDSMPPETVEAARQFAAEGIEGMRPQDQAAVVVFGADALVERPMSALRELGPLESQVVSLNTDLAEAIRLGLALYPPGLARRMVILSDGLANSGNAEAAARLAAASGVEIVAVPLQPVGGAEVVLADVEVPTRLNQGQTFDLTVTIESAIESTALLRISGGGAILIEQRIQLLPGVNRYAFTLTAQAPGLNSFRAEIVPEGEDLFYQNNALAAFTQVIGPPQVLLVADDPVEIANLGPGLLAQGLSVDTTDGAGIPRDLASLAQYQAIVLANVPARNIGPNTMRALQSYVRDLGGGLVVVGGPNSYAPGGYFETPLAESLPVEMTLAEQERLPQITVVYVIDRSGSMSDTSVGGIPKIELAKEAILRSIQLLTPRDQVGVVSFDESATWLVPIQSADNRAQIANTVGGLRAGGGTDIYAGVLAVSRTLPEVEGNLRHVVLLTDGGASEAGIPELVEQMYIDHNITFSVIAIGEGYAPFIETLPELGGGRFHFAFNVETIPEIFTEETVIATRAYVIEGEFVPTLTSSSPILAGIEGVPPLFGYVGTSIKPTATQVLATPQGDPLLASWQYGLGRAVAWTSDATARWGASWVRWDEYARFWGQAVRWSITESATQNVEVRVVQEGEAARIIVEAQTDEGGYLNGLQMDASVVQPDLNAQSLNLEQVAPGRYEGTFEPDDEGAYFVRVAGADASGGIGVAQTAGWVLAYSPEYRSFEGDPDLLAFLAQQTGGGLIEGPAQAFAATLRGDPARLPIWPWLLLAATILLPFDIALRRLVITRTDLQRLTGAVGLGPAPAPAAPRSSRAGALFAARERAQGRIEDRSGSAPRRPVSIESEATQPGSATTPPPARPAAPKPAAPRSGAATASSLLASKRQRRGGADVDQED